MKYKCKKVVAALLTAAMVLSLSPILVFAEGDECSHQHDVEICGFVEAVTEVGCDKECIDTDDDGVIDHAADCAYTPAVAGVECSHRHDESCGGLEEQQEQSEEISVAPSCSCDAKCTDAAVNEECDVCAADLTACEGNEPEQEETVLSEALQALQ